MRDMREFGWGGGLICLRPFAAISFVQCRMPESHRSAHFPLAELQANPI
jgi:hypothetical protein